LGRFRSDLTDKSRPKLGDILITKDGSLGRIAICDQENCCINQSVALLRVNEQTLMPDFVRHSLESTNYQSKLLVDFGGTTIKHLYITRIVKMMIAVPPVGEQMHITGYATELADQTAKTTAALSATIDLLREYRSALITAAVTGQLDIREHEKKMESLV
jgi:type I restriction enzyme S subunit